MGVITLEGIDLDYPRPLMIHSVNSVTDIIEVPFRTLSYYSFTLPTRFLNRK